MERHEQPIRLLSSEVGKQAVHPGTGAFNIRIDHRHNVRIAAHQNRHIVSPCTETTHDHNHSLATLVPHRCYSYKSVETQAGGLAGSDTYQGPIICKRGEAVVFNDPLKG